MHYLSALKCFVSKIMNRLFYFSGLYYLFYKLYRKPGVYILCYHRLVERRKEKVKSRVSVDINQFKKQVAYFSSNFRVISMNKAASILMSRRSIDKDSIVFTFDDGYRDNLELGYDVFVKYNLKPIIFLTASNIENQEYLWPDMIREAVYKTECNTVSINWNEFGLNARLNTLSQKTKFVLALIKEVKEFDEQQKYDFIKYLCYELGVAIPSKCDVMLKWENFSMASLKGIYIGSHTMSHPVLSKITQVEAKKQICDSKLLIQNRTGRKVCHFAYPNGRKIDYTKSIVDMLKPEYETAVTTVPGINYPGADPYELKRIVITCEMGLLDIKVKMLLAKLRNDKKG